MWSFSYLKIYFIISIQSKSLLKSLFLVFYKKKKQFLFFLAGWAKPIFSFLFFSLGPNLFGPSPLFFLFFPLSLLSPAWVSPLGQQQPSARPRRSVGSFVSRKRVLFQPIFNQISISPVLEVQIEFRFVPYHKKHL